jgi:uncharacterized protein (TIGR02145 family)
MVAFNIHLIPIILIFFSSQWAQPLQTNPEPAIIFDDYTYKTIRLENGQHWMAENLRSSIYANGDSVTNPTDLEGLMELNSGAWLHYDNDSTNEATYGKLYNWAAVSDSRNLCPSNWHVATDSDWSALEEYLGGSNVAGAKLKTIDTLVWPYNVYATDEINFGGVPGGFVSAIGQSQFNNQFNQLKERAYWWTSTERDAYTAWYRTITPDYDGISRLRYVKANFLSVRCVEDQDPTENE